MLLLIFIFIGSTSMASSGEGSGLQNPKTSHSGVQSPGEGEDSETGSSQSDFPQVHPGKVSRTDEDEKAVSQILEGVYKVGETYGRETRRPIKERHNLEELKERFSNTKQDTSEQLLGSIKDFFSSIKDIGDTGSPIEEGESPQGNLKAMGKDMGGKIPSRQQVLTESGISILKFPLASRKLESPPWFPLGSSAGKNDKNWGKILVKSFFTDLTSLAANPHSSGLKRPILLDGEVEAAEIALSTENTPYLMTLGASGRGKSLMANELAHRILEKKAHVALRNRRVLKLDFPAFTQTNAALPEELRKANIEDRISALQVFLKEYGQRLILVLDVTDPPNQAPVVEAFLNMALSVPEVPLWLMGRTEGEVSRNEVFASYVTKQQLRPLPLESNLQIVMEEVGPLAQARGILLPEDDIRDFLKLMEARVSREGLPYSAIQVVEQAIHELHRARVQGMPPSIRKIEDEISKYREYLSSIQGEEGSYAELQRWEWGKKLEELEETRQRGFRSLEQYHEEGVFESTQNISREIQGLKASISHGKKILFHLEEEKWDPDKTKTKIQGLKEKIHSMEGQLAEFQSHLVHIFEQLESHGEIPWPRELVGRLNLEKLIVSLSKIKGTSVENFQSFFTSPEESLRRLKERLDREYVGQEHFIRALLELEGRGRVSNKGPRYSMLLVGGSTKGKTELAKVLGSHVDPNCVGHFDMGQYKGKDGINSFLGSPPGYAGDDGALHELLQRCPEGVLNLDEIGKADPQIINSFLFPLLREGVLKNQRGRTMDFRNYRVFLSDNALEDLLRQYPEIASAPSPGEISGPMDRKMAELLFQAVRDQDPLRQTDANRQLLEIQGQAKTGFTEAFLRRVNYIGQVVNFTDSDYRELVQVVFDKNQGKNLREVQRINVRLTEEALNYLAKLSKNKSRDAANVADIIENYVLRQVKEARDQEKVFRNDNILFDYERAQGEFSLYSMDRDFQHLQKNPVFRKAAPKLSENSSSEKPSTQEKTCGSLFAEKRVNP